MKNAYIGINYEKQTIENNYPVCRCKTENDENCIEWNTETIAHITHHVTKNVYEHLNEMYYRCTIEELIAISAYAKQLANDKIRALKKYL